MPGSIVSAMTASFRSVEKRRRRATPVITSTFENVSDIGVCLGLYLGPPAKAGVRSKRGALHWDTGWAGSGGNDSIYHFNQAIGDRISLNGATDSANSVLATASSSGGNTTITLSDGSHVTFIGVSNLDFSFFMTH